VLVLYNPDYRGSFVPILVLAPILALGLFLRAVNISDNPPELFSDEIINFVSARSVIEKGHDLHGNLSPYFSDRTEPRPPVYGYFTYASSKIFGDGALGIRAPAIFFGLACIVLVYLITRELFRDETSALLAAFFMAIIPWSIHYSRADWEPASFLPLLLLSVYMLVYGIRSRRRWVTVLAFGMFSLTVYTYQAAPLYSFLFLSALGVIHVRYFLVEWKVLLAGCFLAGILIIPYVSLVMGESASLGRAERIFTFSEGVTPESIGAFFTNYISHFKASFLFMDGDLNLRHDARTGMIYWVMLPLIIAGLVYLFKSGFDRRSIYFVLFWIAVFPLAAALTNDGVPHATRALAGAPLVCILSGLGAGGLLKDLACRTRRPVYSLILASVIVVSSLVSLALFARNYYYEYPKESYGAWEYGHRSIFARIEELKDKYKCVCMGNLHYGNDLQIIDYYARDWNIDVLSNMDDPACMEKGTLIVHTQRPRQFRRNSFIIERIDMPEDMKSYFIYEVKEP
jgi:4-amino-4-deoxy-L-arabinose transferase-like glycosyltransferase